MKTIKTSVWKHKDHKLKTREGRYEKTDKGDFMFVLYYKSPSTGKWDGVPYSSYQAAMNDGWEKVS